MKKIGNYNFLRKKLVLKIEKILVLKIQKILVLKIQKILVLKIQKILVLKIIRRKFSTAYFKAEHRFFVFLTLQL
mgnify:CR=1 FL=1